MNWQIICLVTIYTWLTCGHESIHVGKVISYCSAANRPGSDDEAEGPSARCGPQSSAEHAPRSACATPDSEFRPTPWPSLLLPSLPSPMLRDFRSLDWAWGMAWPLASWAWPQTSQLPWWAALESEAWLRSLEWLGPPTPHARSWEWCSGSSGGERPSCCAGSAGGTMKSTFDPSAIPLWKWLRDVSTRTPPSFHPSAPKSTATGLEAPLAQESATSAGGQLRTPWSEAHKFEIWSTGTKLLWAFAGTLQVGAFSATEASGTANDTDFLGITSGTLEGSSPEVMCIWDGSWTPAAQTFGKLDSATWVSAWFSAEAVAVVAASTFKSIKKSPFGVKCKGYSWPNFLDHMVCFSTSITASKAWSNVLEIKKGVDPGTISNFQIQPLQRDYQRLLAFQSAVISETEGYLTGATRKTLANLRMQTLNQLCNMIAPYHCLGGTEIHDSKATMGGKQNMTLTHRLSWGITWRLNPHRVPFAKLEWRISTLNYIKRLS